MALLSQLLCCPLLFQHINNFIVHDSNPSFSDGHSVLEMVLATGPIVTKDIPCHMKPSVKRAAVRWESNKKNEFKDAICNSTDSRVAQGAYLEVEYIRNVLSVSGTLKYADSGTA